ncbi:hypothetical protein AB0A77_37435 [Streptomyces varsoviensis]|uniref:hypothetical protein n=1 Tax=Streptomyces varsoviensis TaxID=67373 RepID=UPI0033FD890C
MHQKKQSSLEGFMNRAAKLATLTGAVAMSVVSLGGISAAPALAQSSEGAARGSSAKDFFEPGAKIPDSVLKSGAKLTVKRNSSPGAATPRLAGSVTDLGESCGTDVLQKTSGAGKTTLVLTVSQEVAVQKSGKGGIDWKAVSAEVGFSVTKTYKVENQTRYEVPQGKNGTIEAYPLSHHYQVNAFGGVQVYKPVGVCFNQWTS